VFDNRADADRAQDELLASGFSRQDVRLSNADATGATDSISGATTTTGERHDEGIGASIKHFFSDIFGSDNSEHAQRYSTAVSRGHHVLTVSAPPTSWNGMARSTSTKSRPSGPAGPRWGSAKRCA
jgi:hypothetical protein